MSRGSPAFAGAATCRPTGLREQASHYPWATCWVPMTYYILIVIANPSVGLWGLRWSLPSKVIRQTGNPLPDQGTACPPYDYGRRTSSLVPHSSQWRSIFYFVIPLHAFSKMWLLAMTINIWVGFNAGFVLRRRGNLIQIKNCCAFSNPEPNRSFLFFTSSSYS